VPKNIVFKAGDLVQTHKLAHLQLSRNWRLCGHRHINDRIITWKYNSYTLETLEGKPIDGLYNTQHLHKFEPCEETKLTLDKLTKENNDGEGEDLDVGVEEGTVDWGVLRNCDKGVATERGGTCVGVLRVRRLWALVWSCLVDQLISHRRLVVLDHLRPSHSFLFVLFRLHSTAPTSRWYPYYGAVHTARTVYGWHP
jgi:hypothetical protein